MFAGLTASQYQVVLSALRSEIVKPGQHIVSQGYGNTNLYILRKGRAIERATDSHRMKELRSSIVQIGRLFNEMAFVTGGRSDTAVEADTECTVWFISRGDFQAILKDNPDLAANISYAPETVATMHRTSKYEWLEPGERVEIERKRHWWFFGKRMWFPIVLAGGFALLLAGFANLAPPGLLWLWPVFCVPYVAWHFIDWQNDYFVVTDRHVVHRERVIFVKDQKNQMPLEKVDSIKVKQTGPIEFLFNLGTVTLQGPNQSEVIFDLMHEPQALKNAISAEQERVRAANHVTELSVIRGDVRVAMEIAPRPAPIVVQPTLPKSALQRTKEYLGSNASTFRSTFAPKSRVELNQGKQIIFRRHWLDLLDTVWLPGAIFAAISVLAGFIIAWRFDQILSVSWNVICLPVALLWFLAFAWLFYHYEDWRNDQYILDEDKLVDLDRKPFGGETQRNEVPYDRITTVNADIKGITNTMFNVGDVVIAKTGGDKLVFERVHDPKSVQQDIFKRIEASAEKKRAREKEQRRKELTDWIGIYDEQARLHGNRSVP